MDISGNEVTLKIRTSIREKLIELGVYVDEELPDYIMVMVANKKTPMQMTDDLYLFLGENTQGFTRWLHKILENLESGKPDLKVESEMVVESVPKEPEKDPVPEIVTKKRYLDKDVQIAEGWVETREEFIFTETDDLLLREMEIAAAMEPIRDPKRIKIVPVTPPSKKRSLVSPIQRTSENHPRIKAPKSDSPKSSMRVKPLLLQSTPMSVGSVSSIVRKVPRTKYESSDEEEDEYDPTKPRVGTVASIVKVRDRRPSIPVEKQASKLLLLKAMADANKSTQVNPLNKLPVKVEPYKPTPIAKLAKTISNKESSKEVEKVPESEVLTAAAVEPEQNSEMVDTGAVEDDEELELMQLSPQDGLDDTLTLDPMEYVPAMSNIPYKTEARVIPVETVEPLTFKELNVKQEDAEPLPIKRQINTQFVVTLDGVNPQTILKKRPARRIVNSKSQELVRDENQIELDDVLETEITADLEDTDEFYDGEDDREVLTDFGQLSPVKKKERCQFWPACSKGDKCVYQHPSQLCTKFPNCAFGSRCKAIHPNCKYDRRCTKPDCAFTHTSKPLYLPPTAPPPPRPIQQYAPIAAAMPCKFYPNCTNASCPYTHPKPCHFGMNCRNPGCQFIHKKIPVIPKASKLKWVSPAHILTTSEKSYVKPQLAIHVKSEISKTE